MPMPPAAKETAAASIDDAPSVGTSLAVKRSQEDDPGMASGSSSQVGGDKKRQNRGDVSVIDPASTLEQEVSSGDTIKDEVGTVEDDAEENGEEPDSGEGESDDSESSGPGQGDIIELDREDIMEQLTSGSSILVLETTSNWRSYCRANFCIPQLLRGRPNIECDYRFNLIDRTGERRSDRAWYSQPNRFFHISCIEHLFDLREILDQGWMKMEGGISLVGIFGNTVKEERFPTIVEEWFENKGSVYTINEYKAYKKACETREGEWSNRWSEHCIKTSEDEKHEEQCSCAWEMPEINKSDYFPEERTPRLLSQVLASLAKVSQIDRLTENLLTDLKDMSVKQGTKLLKILHRRG
ncbi:uncharacterized protein BP5553_03130 [Venustampulla echinocandica]|uniref:Uncharacterized protein n=1 Tax=Venustampulla echinocandica TaxID=2656787 RepID=A0A370TTD8_9HELO|nr:uncharacterized protein BP5553_03130 [Venustampulla echinocandica]RDL38790.1 hypothetical protein BP5553_03130 [Venustampulla echinocandica]